MFWGNPGEDATIFTHRVFVPGDWVRLELATGNDMGGGYTVNIFMFVSQLHAEL